ncbi:hypothetical protein LY632_12505 [Erythrobacter sp. SDW2]|uniref:hypothetical protein n=1 Tax=Erythrobacter sp. SDW2 TaxID=2907154 RepID=UPI001F2093AC|nr:hypothetical protein [Erythrobacter sp. SDW2]UIP06495.1 hypothetical protein LY632_12505 [Erythrobacter sp. SDW2]
MNPLPQLLRPAAEEVHPVPDLAKGGEVAHRLQVGLIGLGAMILLVGVADMIMTRAQQTEQAAVPEAAATVEPAPTPDQNNDALEAAGVVPDLPKDAVDEPVPDGPVLPAQGDASRPAGQ